MHQSQPNGSNEFIRHDPCPDCGSSDGLGVSTDGHTFCFVCHTWTPGNGSQSSPRLQHEHHSKGSANRLKKRDISEKHAKGTKSTAMVMYSDSIITTRKAELSERRLAPPTRSSVMKVSHLEHFLVNILEGLR